MPKYAAVRIPSPFEAIERTMTLKDVARDKEVKRAFQSVLGQVTGPEDFERVFPQLMQLDSGQALDLRRFFQRQPPEAPRTKEIVTVDEATGQPVRRIVEDRPGQTFPMPPPEPKAPSTSIIETVDEQTGRPVRRVIEDRPGQTFPMLPPTSRVTPGSFEDFLAATPGEREQMMAARRAYTAAGQAPPREGPTTWQQYQAYLAQQQDAQRAAAAAANYQGAPPPSYAPPVPYERWLETPRLEGLAPGNEYRGGTVRVRPGPGMTLGGRASGVPAAAPPLPAMPPPAVQPGILPSAGPSAAPAAGKILTRPDGTRWRITQVYPDGSFDAEPVR